VTVPGVAGAYSRWVAGEGCREHPHHRRAPPEPRPDLDRHAEQFQKTNRCIPIVIVENLIATRTIA
jgi:hypothetical protein